MQQKKSESFESEVASSVRGLIQRLRLAPNGAPAQSIAFIAARFGEGTSTIAKEYAFRLASENGQKVLLIDAGPIASEAAASGIVETVIAGKAPSEAAYSLGKNLWGSRWVADSKNSAQAGKIIQDAELWKGLLASFDTVVIDAPCLQHSYDGVMLAAKADATVLVVEAEKTPEPVIRNLRDTLNASGAAIAGMVMNKRRYYIPEKVYKRL